MSSSCYRGTIGNQTEICRRGSKFSQAGGGGGRGQPITWPICLAVFKYFSIFCLEKSWYRLN